MDKVLGWFATSPLSTAARVGIASALTYVIDNITGFDLDPAVQVLLVMVVTTLLRWFNPKDGVYGKGTTVVE
jgi:hypothetical protein